jgi:hypothetical protein
MRSLAWLNKADLLAWMPARIRIWLFPGFFVSFGALFLVLTAWSQGVQHGLQEREREATGTVIEIEYSSRPSCPFIQFSDSEGRERRFWGNVCSKPPSFSKGQQVQVVYTADDSAQPRMAEPSIVPWHGPALFALLWLSVGALGVRSALAKRRELNAAGSLGRDL